MFARIICGRVAGLSEDFPALAPGECAHVEECGNEVEIGWAWTPEGFAPPPAQPEPDPNAAIDAQILALEARQTPRRMRDALLTPEGAAWMSALEAQIAGLRAQRSTGGGA